MPRVLFQTPPDMPEEFVCRTLEIPSSKEWLGIFNAALLQTIYSWNWEQVNETDLTADECTALCYDVFEEYLTSGGQCGSAVLPTPYWDDATDLDDELPADIQPWYGEVTDPNAPADELTFVENAAIWAFTGFIAYAGDIGAAMFFRTIAPDFVLSLKRGDLGEVVRIIIDGVQYDEIDTTPVAAGEIIDVPILTDGSSGEHDILLVRKS